MQSYLNLGDSTSLLVPFIFKLGQYNVVNSLMNEYNYQLVKSWNDILFISFVVDEVALGGPSHYYYLWTVCLSFITVIVRSVNTSISQVFCICFVQNTRFFLLY